MQLKSTLSLFSLLSYAAAHGFVNDISVGNNWYPGSNPFQDPWKRPTPDRVVWSFFKGGNGPVTDVTTKDIVCNADAQPAKLYIESVNAGSKVTFYWTNWPTGHLGPVMTYLAKCNGNCEDNDPSSLSYFKIDEKGWENGKWASDELIANNNSWTVTLPSDISSGKYIIRHELLSLQEASRSQGAQFYPMCANIEIIGGGNANPGGVKFPGAYKTEDPGILIDIYNRFNKYTAPGPPVYGSDSSQASSGSQTSTDSTTHDDSPAGVENIISTISSLPTTDATLVKPSSTSTAQQTTEIKESSKVKETSTIKETAETQKKLETKETVQAKRTTEAKESTTAIYETSSNRELYTEYVTITSFSSSLSSKPALSTPTPVTITQTAIATEVYESRANGELVSVSSKDLSTITTQLRATTAAVGSVPARENRPNVVTVTYFATTTTYVTRAPRTTSVTVFNENVVTLLVKQTQWTQNTPVTVYQRDIALQTNTVDKDSGDETVLEPEKGTSPVGKSLNIVKTYIEKLQNTVKGSFY